MSSKYATLPDLDLSQDIYETPDLAASDVSTVQTTIPDDDYDFSETNSDDDGSSAISQIDHTRLRAADAAQVFSNAQVDATDVDFSDRITRKRKSYIVSTRRRRHVAAVGDGSDDEGWEGEPETVEQRLARLRREVDELRVQIGKKKKAQEEEGGEDVGRGLEELAEALGGLVPDEGGAQERLARKLVGSLGASVQVRKEIPPAAAGGEEQPATTATYTMTYAPGYEKSHTLGKIADFDDRLTVLEKVMGMSASALADSDKSMPSNAIIPHLEELTRQMEVLSGSTTSSLDAASRRVKQLALDTDKLTEARKAAKLAAADGVGTVDPLENDETVAKINALYGVLPTIEKMKPVLPVMLDRLRSLRDIHQNAASASETLRKIESRQEEMAVEIQKWEEALEKVEEVVKESTGTVEGNMLKVEGWVQEIERKMQTIR